MAINVKLARIMYSLGNKNRFCKPIIIQSEHRLDNNLMLWLMLNTVPGALQVNKNYIVDGAIILGTARIFSITTH